MGLISGKSFLKNPSQLIKCIILFFFGIFTFFQIAKCVNKYIHPSTSTYSEFILNSSIRYPCITICRRPAYKTEMFPAFGLSPSQSLESTNFFKNFNFDKYTLTEFFEASTYTFDEIFGQYAFASKGNSAYSPNERTLNITSSFHFKRGRCFTFQPLISSDTFSVSGGYMFYLLQNITNQKINEYGVSTHGFQMYLHDINEAVTYDEDERNNFLEILDMEASEDMRVKFEIQEFTSTPIKNSCKPDQNYSKSKCEEVCINTQIIMENNCKAPFIMLSMDNDFFECSNFTTIRDLIKDYTGSSYREILLKNCDCPLACNFTVYKTSIINRRKIEDLLVPNSMFCLYTANLFTRMSEVSSYDWPQLLSDIGGSMGFLLGLSVLSLISLGEEVFKIIFRWIFKTKPKSNQDGTELKIPSNGHFDENDSICSPNLETKHEKEMTNKLPHINEFIIDYNSFKKISEINNYNRNGVLKK